MSNALEKLGLSAPLMLAPMAGVSGGRLASAVSGAGGLGIIGGGYCDRDWLMRELDLATGAPIGVGFITWALQRNPKLLGEVLQCKPSAVFLSFGDIAEFVAEIHAAGIVLIAQVQTVAAAIKALNNGADIIVAQGSDAGGHIGTRGTFALIPAIRDAIGDAPLVAAGGITDGRGIAAAMMLGADAVLCGTAFYTATESLAPSSAKAIALQATGDETRTSKAFDAARGLNWPDPWIMRAKNNAFLQQWADRSEHIGPEEQLAFAKSVAREDPETIPVIIGEGIDQVSIAEDAASTVVRLIAEARFLQTLS